MGFLRLPRKCETPLIIIKMNDKVEHMMGVMKMQQKKIENLTARIIWRETA